MDVEPCYPFFSAELESTEALASAQWKVMRAFSVQGKKCSEIRQTLRNSDPKTSTMNFLMKLFPFWRIRIKY